MTFTARCRGLRGHHVIRDALAGGSITVSYAEWIAETLATFPADDRGAVEEILVEAAAGGALLEDLAALAARIYRLLAPGGDEERERSEEADRRLTLGKTLGGVGRLNADLNRRATALADQVIGALAVKKGPEDTRTAPQRRHDALAEAFQRLIDADLLPERGGTKPHLRLDIPLAILRGMHGGAQAEADWIRTKAADLARARMRTRANIRDATTGAPTHGEPDLADDLCHAPDPGAAEECDVGAHNAARDAGARDAGRRSPQMRGPGDHDAYLRDARVRDDPPDDDPPDDDPPDDDPPDDDVKDIGEEPGHRPGDELPNRFAGGVGSPAVLAGAGTVSDRLAGALACDSRLTPMVTARLDPSALAGLADRWAAGHHIAGRGPCATGGEGCRCDCHQPLSQQAHLRLQRTLLHWAVQVLSGPDGLASYLRQAGTDRTLNSPSIILDVGSDTDTVPAPLARAVRKRDRTCRFPHCDHPAELSQVHHIVPRYEHGPTSLTNLLTLCAFHHLTVVHTWGWTIRLNPDGGTTATSPQGVFLHDSGPPGTRPPLWAA